MGEAHGTARPGRELTNILQGKRTFGIKKSVKKGSLWRE